MFAARGTERENMRNSDLVAAEGRDGSRHALSRAIERAKTSEAALFRAHVIGWSPESFHTPGAITALVIGTAQTADPGFAGAAPLFAVSTMIAWFYDGRAGWTYLFGEGGQIVYKVIFCGFVALGWCSLARSWMFPACWCS